MKAKIWDTILTRDWKAYIVFNDLASLQSTTDEKWITTIDKYWYSWRSYNKRDWLAHWIEYWDVIGIIPTERIYFYQ